MPSSRIRRILIANRGEIALRVARTCRELGIETIAIYSTPDRMAPHVRYCDEAYEIGPAASSESYLRQDAIVELAVRTRSDAIHPGYGFLAENATFAESCEAQGVRFIGPPADAIRSMGDKTAARKMMQDAGVPVVPGTIEPVVSAAEAARFASDVGYPILLKAAAGGGGKGMRAVPDESSLERSLASAQSEARSAFGDGRVFLEKLIQKPRHIEFQILADAHGNIVHLFERECSIQRRHQKVIEESPSPIMTEALRARMGEAAVEAARACGYVNAGTVEFLVDENLDFYFMEMNTRLQVEHPVTEWITGLDLVAEQIRVAEGEKLSFGQSDVSIHGHSIESRVYAEDPANGFLPDSGTLLRHAAPDGPFVRVDAGVEEGGEVEIHYDPMISKLTVWGQTREEAIRRMDRALSAYEIDGVRTTIPFCRFVMQNEDYRRGDISTHFIEQHFDPSELPRLDTHEFAAGSIAAATAIELGSNHRPNDESGGATSRSRWHSRRELR
ncbi:MAG: acetyl-CoA carboxylase biotin carboxylase subunit [Rhodothermales bacterium]|nr:acetyl-CoA carboxylase biotin carboxylase subunit [Rhodothermales bacterium]